VRRGTCPVSPRDSDDLRIVKCAAQIVGSGSHLDELLSCVCTIGNIGRRSVEIIDVIGDAITEHSKGICRRPDRDGVAVVGRSRGNSLLDTIDSRNHNNK
jgi:hypothetical protein